MFEFIMPNTKELRRRIKSVKNTAQITKAMQMVSATKMRRAQSQAMASRNYTALLAHILSQASHKFAVIDHLLLKTNEAIAIAKKAGVILLSTDKGLCGSLNTNLIKVVQTAPELTKYSDLVFYTVGRKGRDTMVRSQKILEADFPNQEKVEFVQAVAIRRMVVEAFTTDQVGDVYLVYPHFISTLRQEPRIIKLLPISVEALENFLKLNSVTYLGGSSLLAQNGNGDFLFEPSIPQIIEYALIHFLDTQIYQALLETKASEHSARMMAMQNATNNAKDLVADLSLTYNQARQSAITTQILEIASAGAALE